MAKSSRKKIKSLFAKSNAATTKAEKGKHLEDLAVYLFEMVPGISLSARDKKNVYETEARRRHGRSAPHTPSRDILFP
jgi:hypothetical protein